MPLYELTKDWIVPLPQTTFAKRPREGESPLAGSPR